MAKSVLPKLKVPKGYEPLRNLDDLLTPEQKVELQADLTRMANLRRRVAAESANTPLASGDQGI